MKDRFRYYLPLEINKAKNEAGEEVMKIRGVASTMDEDTDGEVLDPNGFDFDYFLNSGFINWHHQQKDDPEAIVGEPVRAFVKDNQFYVEGELYAWSDLAKKIWNLANNLKNSKSKRRLGMSVEGKAKERHPANENYITKSVITGLAITPMPKNSATILDVIKGEGGWIDEKEEFESTEGGEVIYLVDVTKPNGERIQVDLDYNVKVTKAMTTDSASGGALKREDLEGSPNLPKRKKIAEGLIILSKAVEDGLVKLDKIKNKISDSLKV